MSEDRKCLSCANWTPRAPAAGAAGYLDGQCRAAHRFWRVSLPKGGFALMDSFGPEATRSRDVCDAWKATQ